jgi:hypothetical protein
VLLSPTAQRTKRLWEPGTFWRGDGENIDLVCNETDVSQVCQNCYAMNALLNLYRA